MQPSHRLLLLQKRLDDAPATARVGTGAKLVHCELTIAAANGSPIVPQLHGKPIHVPEGKGLGGDEHEERRIGPYIPRLHEMTFSGSPVASSVGATSPLAPASKGHTTRRLSGELSVRCLFALTFPKLTSRQQTCRLISRRNEAGSQHLLHTFAS